MDLPKYLPCDLEDENAVAGAAIETSALAHFQITRRKAMKVNRKGAERQLVVHRPASAKLRELSRLAQQISYCGDNLVW